MAGTRKGRRGFGHVRQLPSGRWQASYLGPDGERYTARTPEGGPLTFSVKSEADGWLSLRQSEILRDAWLPPHAVAPAPSAPLTVADYSVTWLAGRELADRTRADYAQILRDHILPAFGEVPVGKVTPAAVREWHAGLAKTTGPVMRAHAYGLLRTVMGTAVADDLIAANPCRVRGAGSAKRAKKIRPATLAELETLVAALPERYRLMAMLAAWCQLRFGELAELRRKDVDVKSGVVRVQRGVVRLKGERKVKDPKSEAGSRDVTIPPHLKPMVRSHLAKHTAAGRDALLFPAAGDPAKHMAPSALQRVYYPARAAAGRPDLRFHDLRHTGATLSAAAGATLAELMRRLGHSTPDAAMVYQHATDDRDAAIAAALSEFHEAKVVDLRPRRPAEGAAIRSRKAAAGHSKAKADAGELEAKLAAAEAELAELRALLGGDAGSGQAVP